jgi:hypothetical protein
VLVKVLGGDDNTDQNGQAVGLSQSELIDKSGGFEHPAYWVGPRPGTDQYELTSTTDGRIYIRYLTGGAAVGVNEPQYLTVGTYAVPNASQALENAAAAGGTKVSHQKGFDLLKEVGGKGVYVVFNDQPDLQIEIFSPTPGQASSLATDGSLQPVA